MTAAWPSFLLSQSLFQCLGGPGGLVDPGHAVFHGQNIGFWKVIPGHDLTLFLRPFQKFPSPGGDGGVVQVKNTDDILVPHSHIIADR